MSHKKPMDYFALDLFSGCGGLSQGLKQAGFKVIAAVEIDQDAAKAYGMNHPEVKIFTEDIKKVNTLSIKKLLNGRTLHLVAGCPPCQGFSSIRRLNKKEAVDDERNSLIMEYLRFVTNLRPEMFMMENVPGLANYHLFQKAVEALQQAGYKTDYKIVNVKDYGIAQRRKRLVFIGSLRGPVKVYETNLPKLTVRDAIGSLESTSTSKDPLHKDSSKRTDFVVNRISHIPKDGGSLKDAPEEFHLDCHKRANVGFADVYGRLRWDDYSTTITGGCLNPSKGRFLHPEENRTLTPREAALLQSFPANYKFPTNIRKDALALLIGNALPPKFAYLQSRNLKKHYLKFH